MKANRAESKTSDCVHKALRYQARGSLAPEMPATGKPGYFVSSEVQETLWKLICKTEGQTHRPIKVRLCKRHGRQPTSGGGSQPDNDQPIVCFDPERGCMQLQAYFCMKETHSSSALTRVIATAIQLLRRPGLLFLTLDCLLGSA